MLVYLIAKYTMVIFIISLVYFLFKDRELFLRVIVGCLCIWILGRLLEGINIYFLKFFPQSFPSDHTAIGFGIGASIFFKRRILGLILMFLAILMGYTRVLVGFHQFVDIVGGVIIGFGCAFLVNRVITSKMPV